MGSEMCIRDRITAATKPGFVAAVIGGIESLVGAVLGGLTLGIILAIILMYVGGSLVFIAAFLILILVLLLRPQGIIGAKGGRRA